MLVVACVELGSWALNPGISSTWLQRLFLAALATFAVIYTVAQSRGNALWNGAL